MVIDDTSGLSLALVREPEHSVNPYPLYHRLRANDPVFWDEGMEGWVLTRYSDVVAMLRDSRYTAERFMLDTSWLPEELFDKLEPPIRALTRQMLFLDPPDHTRLRGLVAKAFTPRVVEGLRVRIQQVVDDLLDAVRQRGEMDLVREFSYPLPAIVIAEMLGVPAADRDRFTQWTSDFGMLLGGNDVGMEEVARCLYGVSDFMEYFRQIIRERRTMPKDDVMQAMIDAEERGDTLSEDELLGNCVLLLAAGHGTTTHLISNGMLALVRSADQLPLLKERPSLIPSAILELLRYDSPVQMTSRRAKEDHVIGDKQIMAGQDVLAVLGAANHDPAQFSEPDRLDIQRIENRQVAFGQGIHYCLGAPLARLEAEIAVSTLVRRLDSPRLLAQPTRGNSVVFRGVQELPIAFSLQS